MVSVPQVCKQWRNMCRELKGVHLYFQFWDATVLARWRLQRPLEGSAGGGSAAPAGGEQQGDARVTGMCELFPRATAITMLAGHDVEDVHVIALAKCHKCPGLKIVDFSCCWNLADAAVLEWAHLWKVSLMTLSPPPLAENLLEDTTRLLLCPLRRGGNETNPLHQENLPQTWLWLGW